MGLLSLLKTEKPISYGSVNKPYYYGSRVGFFDIETTNLDADFGNILTYCIKPLGVDKVIKQRISKKDIDGGREDYEIVNQCVNDVSQFEVLVGYYSTYFDIPYLRTRALFHEIPFPPYGSIFHIDDYFLAKRLFKMSRYRLEAFSDFFSLTPKTIVSGKIWNKAKYGDDKSLEKILDHNVRDVKMLEEFHVKKIEGQVKFNRKSI